MSVPEFLKEFDPETSIVDPNLPKDKWGDPYLPISHPLAARKITPYPSQPGKYIMAHITDARNGHPPLSKQVESLLDEGIISPRRYAIFSASPTFSWGDTDEPTAQVVCRSPQRWSREDMDRDDKYISPWFEGMFGLTVPEATQISPKGTSFWIEDKERKILIGKTDIFSFVPPHHIIGLIRLTDQTHAGYKDSIQTLDTELLTGKKPEKDCIDDFVQRNLSSVKIDVIAPETEESLLQTLAAAYTQNRLLIEINRQLDETPKHDLRRVQPSFHWTAKLLEAAIEELSKVEFWKYNSDLISQKKKLTL